MNQVLVSIIIPAYNAENFLDETVGLVVAQTYSHWELIIVNDGSTDNTPKLADNWVKKDKRITVIHKPNTGVSDSRNKGMEVSKGEYIAFLDADDLWHPSFIEKKITILENNMDYGMVNSNVEFIDSESKKLPIYYNGVRNENISKIKRLEHINESTGPSGFLCKKQLALEIGGFNKELSNTADKLFYIEMSKHQKIYSLNETLWFYRYHNENMHSKLKMMINDYFTFFYILKQKKYFENNKEQLYIKYKIFKICLFESIKQQKIYYVLLCMKRYCFR